MKRIQSMIILGEVLSYVLIITFIFADTTFDLTSIFRPDSGGLTPQMALVGACLVGLVGAINVWLTWYYIYKSNTMRDWLVVCAWTHRVKCGGRWVSLEDFFHEHLGFEVTHGLSDPELFDMREELDAKWRQFCVEHGREAAPSELHGAPGQRAPSPAA